ncbi:hypothetical protein, partial [Geminocystis herdmanii]|uniref:hypothetical protein n=1 Tax=Geminocystis herdmanii TaxID=669359 RepID=UPI000344F8D3
MKNSHCCFDSNIWLYRFLIDPNSDNLEEIRKHNIAKNITNTNNIIISIQVLEAIS